MIVQHAVPADFDAWLDLAREVEPVFGPMADEKSFQQALRNAFAAHTAFCIRAESDGKNGDVQGGVVISPETNEIAWLAVTTKSRGKGYGRALIEFAINQLNQQQSIFVQTFDESVPQGKAARSLYKNLGFVDDKLGGLNPADIPTVIMRLPGS